jgi:hypothetical protein
MTPGGDAGGDVWTADPSCEPYLTCSARTGSSGSRCVGAGAAPAATPLRYPHNGHDGRNPPPLGTFDPLDDELGRRDHAPATPAGRQGHLRAADGGPSGMDRPPGATGSGVVGSVPSRALGDRRAALEALTKGWRPQLQLSPMTDQSRRTADGRLAARRHRRPVVKGAASRCEPGQRRSWVKVNSVGVRQGSNCSAAL